ncbi:DNA-directed RNA polymerase III subunit RPC8-like [Vitis riparia]|uniref:DNA-directed RNA polymerase III subunit RPC8-like n=1 Tax=Vitis riparia TaxID=96939 RepID=UPI00155B0715|nr:DNA-directed RNA polymerase III subunit RPC8-like [Vitis riparia]
MHGMSYWVHMFFLSLIEHTLRLPPHLLDLSLDKTIQGELENQFLDKVIADLGLCISVYDIRSIDGDFVFPADGASTYTYLLDSLKTSTDWSILCQIHPTCSTFFLLWNSRSQVIWIRDNQEQKFPIDGIDKIRFQVQSVSYSPVPVEQPKESKPFAPMVILVYIDVPHWKMMPASDYYGLFSSSSPISMLDHLIMMV